MHYTNIQVRFKTGILKLNLCNYSDAHMLFKGTITVVNTATADANANNTNKKNCTLFTDCISKINNT